MKDRELDQKSHMAEIQKEEAGQMSEETAIMRKAAQEQCEHALEMQERTQVMQRKLTEMKNNTDD